MTHLKEYNDFSKVSKEIERVSKSLRGMVRNILPNESYEDEFLDLIEMEGFDVKVNKGNGIVTSVVINGIIGINKIESEFNRILSRMKSIKQRLEKIYGFNCHFMIFLNGKGQQKNNPITHRNDDYCFLGLGHDKYGRNNKESKILSEDEVSLKITFMII